MCSYVFMKLLEMRPEKYDAGIGRHARKIKREIIRRYVKPGMTLLDIGCGTGELLEGALKAGASVTGIDISPSMLAVARARLAEYPDQKRVCLHHVPSGVVDMERLFDADRFDLVTATLVASELCPDELRWILGETWRVLSPGGTFVLADEVRPRTLLKRVVHAVVRVPVALATGFLAGTTTTPLAGLEERLRRSGFDAVETAPSLFGSFATITAIKRDRPEGYMEEGFSAGVPEDDRSWWKFLWDYTGRWFPCPAEPGLRTIGNPGPAAPVIVTGNFHLSLRRVEKALAGTDCYLLVVPSGGINVWCAACGGALTAHSVIRVLKTSGIAQRVGHRRLILPQLSASGIDRALLRAATGWDALFGPVEAGDLPSYLKNNCSKFPEQCRARFPLRFRMEMLLSMNALVWAVMSAVLLAVNPSLVLPAGGLYWAAGFLLYAGFSLLPGESGHVKALVLSAAGVSVIAAFSHFVMGEPAGARWGWMAALVLMTFWFGFDLKGIVGGYASEAVALFTKIGITSLAGYTFSAAGTPVKDDEKCTHCRICISVCPRGVFDRDGDGEKVILRYPGRCLSCGACVRQCPEDALFLK